MSFLSILAILVMHNKNVIQRNSVSKKKNISSTNIQGHQKNIWKGNIVEIVNNEMTI